MDRTPVQLLFVEDSEMDAELSVRALEQGGFDVSREGRGSARPGRGRSEAGSAIFAASGRSFRLFHAGL